MSFEIWPPVPPEELQARLEETQYKMLIDVVTGVKKRELDWIVDETLNVLRELKHGLDDCYALLAPIDPGSKLPITTPGYEKVKGTITRVGTRIVRGVVNLQLRSLPSQTITINPDRPIHIAPLAAIHTHLTECIDLVGILLSESSPPAAKYLSAQLRALAHALTDSTALLKGSPDHPPSHSAAATHVPQVAAWATASSPSIHFSPLLPPSISFHLVLQDSWIVLWLRSLEPAHTPVNIGTKLGLAIGTVRRLEHDEMDMVFRYDPEGEGDAHGQGMTRRRKGPFDNSKATEVFVREKVKVSAADPNLISLYAKLGSLSNSLAQARENLAVVMGEDLDLGSNSS